MIARGNLYSRSTDESTSFTVPLVSHRIEQLSRKKCGHPNSVVSLCFTPEFVHKWTTSYEFERCHDDGHCILYIYIYIQSYSLYECPAYAGLYIYIHTYIQYSQPPIGGRYIEHKWTYYFACSHATSIRPLFLHLFWLVVFWSFWFNAKPIGWFGLVFQKCSVVNITSLPHGLP
jgi:hypothetical protein